MNKEDIIRKAEEDEWIEITQFVKLAVLQEREACAKVCEGRLQEGLNFEGCATAIRARGKE